ncbi:MAG: peptidoglycan-binding protein [Candidatus Omnitrophica bacterium]|nr:peptidoglycan-binding protein [Candidatus Omnitrophota bacterium]
MVQGFILAVGMLVLLTGCATTQQGPSTADLQMRVTDLENQIAAKDAEIKDLKYTMKDLSYDMDRSKAHRGSSSSSKPFNYAKNDEILRVKVSAEKVQEALKTAGYYKGNVDGKLGTGTKAAITKFQKDHGLKADGIVGERTWGELKRASGE